MIESRHRPVDGMRAWVRNRNWRLWVVAFIIGIVGAITYMTLTTREYRVRTTVMYMDPEAQSGQLAALMSQFDGLSALAGLTGPKGGSERAQAMAVLGSRQLARDFAATEELVPNLFPELWDAENLRWGGTAPNDWQIADRFLTQILKISTDSKSEVTTIVVTWTDPVIAADIANKYVRFGNEKLRNAAIAENEAALKFLAGELASAGTVELREAVARISEARLKTLMLARSTQDFAFRVIDPAAAPPLDSPAKPSIVIALLLAAGLVVAVWSIAALAARNPRTPSTS